MIKELETCKNCGRPIILSRDLPKIGIDNNFGSDDLWLHVEYLSDVCLLKATPSGIKKMFDLEEVIEK
mgnify:FL=1